jgi:hypothetical protein
MAELFRRAWSLQVGTLDLSKLAMKFKVKSSLKAEPNTCDVEVYNLSDEHRSLLETTTAQTLKLAVGYNDRTHQIFLGQVRTCFTQVSGPDRITKFSSGDGEQAILGTRIRVTYGNQIQIDTAIENIAKVLGIGVGNLSPVTAKLKSRGLASIYPQGVALSGNAWRELATICKSCGLETTIQDGALLLLEQGKALEGSAVRLSPSTGLVGSPTADNDGTVNCQALLVPELRPGVKVQLESLSVGRTVYRVYDAEYTGDTHGQDWYASLGMQRVKGAVVTLGEVVI